MATFKVGQRVRIVSSVSTPELIGYQATIISELRTRTHWTTGKQYQGYDLAVDGIGTVLPRAPRAQLCFHSHHLAPLTDPKADAFIARIKQLGPLSEPIHQFVTTADGTYEVLPDRVTRISR